MPALALRCARSWASLEGGRCGVLGARRYRPMVRASAAAGGGTRLVPIFVVEAIVRLLFRHDFCVLRAGAEVWSVRATHDERERLAVSLETPGFDGGDAIQGRCDGRSRTTDAGGRARRHGAARAMRWRGAARGTLGREAAAAHLEQIRQP